MQQRAIVGTEIAKLLNQTMTGGRATVTVVVNRTEVKGVALKGNTDRNLRRVHQTDGMRWQRHIIELKAGSIMARQGKAHE